MRFGFSLLPVLLAFPTCLAWTQILFVSPGSIAFTWYADTPVPPGAVQRAGITTLEGQSEAVVMSPFGHLNASRENAVDFAVVSPSIGVTPTVFGVALNEKVVPYLKVGYYVMSVGFGAPNQPVGPGTGTSMLVTLRLYYRGKPVISSVTDAASGQTLLSPGQHVIIRGQNLSTPPLEGHPAGDGRFPTELGNTRVLIGGVLAPLLYVSQDRLECIVPTKELAGKRSAEVVVERPSLSQFVYTSESFPVTLAERAPGVYTSGEGSSYARGGVILNATDGVRPNSEQDPAAAGSAITFFANGVGAWNASLPDGSVVLIYVVPARGVRILEPSAPVAVTIGGQPAQLLYSAAAPGQVYSRLQVNAVMPAGLAPGPQPLVLKVGDSDNSAQKAVVWVK